MTIATTAVVGSDKLPLAGRYFISEMMHLQDFDQKKRTVDGSLQMSVSGTNWTYGCCGEVGSRGGEA